MISKLFYFLTKKDNSLKRFSFFKQTSFDENKKKYNLFYY